MPASTDSGQPDRPVLAKEKHPNWNGTTTKAARKALHDNAFSRLAMKP